MHAATPGALRARDLHECSSHHPDFSKPMSGRISFFSRAPLNYESLKRRCIEFSTSDSRSPDFIVDYIAANRKLQRSCKKTQPYRFGFAKESLNLELGVLAQQLDRELWQFLEQYWSLCISSESVVRAYISSSVALNSSESFLLVTENYRHQLTSRERIDMGPIIMLQRSLLSSGDFHGCFKLLDDTVNHQTATQQTLRRLRRGVNLVLSGFIALIASHEYLIHAAPVSPILESILPLLLALYSSAFSAAALWLGIFTSGYLRVSWRPHLSLWHRYLHREEINAVNKFVTYFEEYNEVNVKNYHTSKVWPSQNLETFDQNDYELHLPPDASEKSPLTLFFKQELNRRKMVWNPLKEETMFLDFWINHGENYEWIEPDQDPAEISIIQKKPDSPKIDNPAGRLSIASPGSS